MTTFTPDQWVIVALIFILGLLIGAFLTAGGRRKWKARYREESAKREALEREHRDHVKQMEVREKEWHDRDTASRPAVADRPVVEDRPVTNRRTGSRRDEPA
ncbi:MAG: LapA family protein [Sphingomonas sp.]|nr:LapA family protein [Sphingomonas sp.]